MTARLAGRVIIVTGGTKGIGRGIAERLAREGATVVITGRDQTAGDEVVADAPDGATIRFIRADAADPAHTARVVGATMEEFGRIDGLVNNAATLRRETILTTEPDFLQHVLSVNLMGAIEYTRQVMRPMIAAHRGSIVNIGSTHAWSGLADLFPYSIAKGGLLTLTHHVARNYAKDGIRCNWVTVGWVITPGEIDVWERERRSPEWIEQKAKEVVPLGRLQTPEEIGAAVAYLMSDDADQVTDTELDITGGLRV